MTLGEVFERRMTIEASDVEEEMQPSGVSVGR
jgi:hypothetical protein